MDGYNHTFETSAKSSDFLDALTTRSGLGAWWSTRGTGSAEAGEEHSMQFKKGDTEIEMRFRVDAVSDQEVVWTCLANGNPAWPGTTLTWRLHDGQLHFEHTGFESKWVGTPPYTMTLGGWAHFMASLERHLRGENGEPWG